MAPQPPGRRLQGPANSLTGSTSPATGHLRVDQVLCPDVCCPPPAAQEYKDDLDWSAGISCTDLPRPGPVSRQSAVQPGGRWVLGGSGIGADWRKPGVPVPCRAGPWADQGCSRPDSLGGSPHRPCLYTVCLTPSLLCLLRPRSVTAAGRLVKQAQGCHFIKSAPGPAWDFRTPDLGCRVTSVVSPVWIGMY